MDASNRQANEFWVNRALRIPAVPASPHPDAPRRPISVLLYRLKITSLLLLAAACALWRTELRLALLLTCWLLCATCETACCNYPWRESLTAWIWRIRLTVPYSEVLFCSALLLVWSQSGAGCEMAHPLVSASIFWSCGLVAWPLVRRRWHRQEIKEVEYDQFSAIRPWVLTLPRSLLLVLSTLQSPSLLVPLVMGVSACVAAPLLPGWASDAWAVCAGALVLGCLALLCCNNLVDHSEDTLKEWKGQGEEYAAKISHALSMARLDLSAYSACPENISAFERLSVQVPLLKRETDILFKNGRALGNVRVRGLEDLLDDGQLRQFGERLDRLGPRTTRCCLS